MCVAAVLLDFLKQHLDLHHFSFSLSEFFFCSINFFVFGAAPQKAACPNDFSVFNKTKVDRVDE